MKRLLLVSLIGLTCTQHAHAEHTLQLALQTAKDKFDSSLIAQATVPIIAGATAGLFATAASAAYYHSRYYKYTSDYNVNPLLINTIVHGGKISKPLKDFNYKTIYDRLEHGSAEAGSCLAHNLTKGFCGFGFFGALYSLYKNGFKDNCKVTAGIVGSGLLFAIVADQFLFSTGDSKMRTLFSPAKLTI